VNPEIINKKKEINASKIYSPVDMCAERAKKQSKVTKARNYFRKML